MAKNGNDIFSREKRSDVMSRIKSKNSKTEKEVFSFLRKNKVYFQKHPRKIFGRPDISIPTRKIAVFIDSDFWHGWQYPKWEHKITSPFWRKKLESNRRRDKLVTRRLRKEGYSVLRVWSHQLVGIHKKPSLIRILKFLKTKGL